MLDTLLNPDIGMVLWTIISFLILVVLLKVLAWGPLLGAIEAREHKLREERERAEKARADAERISKELEARLDKAADEARAVLAKAGQEGESLRSQLKAQADDEAKAMVDKARSQMDEDKRRVLSELRQEVSALSLLAAERLMKKSVDENVHKSVLGQFMDELSEGKGKN
ncbi:MAG: F0F1 ATP synthase subunit B [Elusimicrobia bacterium]|nr:F0F1 ATP synthase subunit B [Elusimicrobiota bacterium]